MWRFLLAAAIAVSSHSTALAQGTSYEDFLKSVDQRQGEIEKFRAELMHENPDRRLAAMEFLLRSEDPVLVDMAKEVGLFSNDPRLRKAALTALFHARPNLRLQMTALGKESVGALDWLSRRGGSHDGNVGFVILKVGEYDEDNNCWRWNNNKPCLLQMAGDKVELTPERAQAAMSLGDDGVLRGRIFTDEKGVADLTVDLME